MSKTVLLPDSLHKKIKETTIKMGGVPTNMSMAKKIELFSNLSTTNIDLSNTNIQISYTSK